jgi:membrane associated rhomboid family serine protease
MFDYGRLTRHHALGNFRDLLRDMTTNGTMIFNLDGVPRRGSADRSDLALTQIANLLSEVSAVGLDDNVMVMTTREFGRRVNENASGGTDDGRAGVQFIAVLHSTRLARRSHCRSAGWRVRKPRSAERPATVAGVPVPWTQVNTCFHHTDVEAGRSCSRCGRPACPACLRQASVGSHCFECVKASAPSRSERVRVQRVMGTATPYVTYSLVAANLIIFLLSHDLSRFGRTSLKGSVLQDYALRGPEIDILGEWWRVVTSGFLHFDFRHVAFNMIVLFLLGRRVERRVGAARMVGIYFVSMLAGSFGALLLSPTAATAGASGAVYGLMSAAYIAERTAGGDPWNDGLGSLIIINLIFTFMSPSISIGGHLGGLAGGAIVTYVMGRAALSGVQGRKAAGAIVAVGVAAMSGCVLIAPFWANPIF